MQLLGDLLPAKQVFFTLGKTTTRLNDFEKSVEVEQFVFHFDIGKVQLQILEGKESREIVEEASAGSTVGEFPNVLSFGLEAVIIGLHSFAECEASQPLLAWSGRNNLADSERLCKVPYFGDVCERVPKVLDRRFECGGRRNFVKDLLPNRLRSERREKEEQKERERDTHAITDAMRRTPCEICGLVRV